MQGNVETHCIPLLGNCQMVFSCSPDFKELFLYNPGIWLCNHGDLFLSAKLVLYIIELGILNPLIF